MNSQAAKRIAQKHGLEFIYTNFNDNESRQLWYLVTPVECNYMLDEPREFYPAELRDLTRDEIESICKAERAKVSYLSESQMDEVRRMSGLVALSLDLWPFP